MSTEENTEKSLAEFIKPVSNEELQNTIAKAEPEKPEVNDQVDIEARKKAKNRHAYELRKARLDNLRAHQIKGSVVTISNYQGKIRRIDITDESEYLQLIDDLCENLKTRELIVDYNISSNDKAA